MAYSPRIRPTEPLSHPHPHSHATKPCTHHLRHDSTDTTLRWDTTTCSSCSEIGWTGGDSVDVHWCGGREVGCELVDVFEDGGLVCATYYHPHLLRRSSCRGSWCAEYMISWFDVTCQSA